MLEQDKLSEAEAAFKDAIRLQPQTANYYHILGHALERQDKLSKAREYFSEAVDLEPNNRKYQEDVERIQRLRLDRER
jgi:Tfp pilus assembly protein PilF